MSESNEEFVLIYKLFMMSVSSIILQFYTKNSQLPDSTVNLIMNIIAFVEVLVLIFIILQYCVQKFSKYRNHTTKDSSSQNKTISPELHSWFVKPLNGLQQRALESAKQLKKNGVYREIEQERIQDNDERSQTFFCINCCLESNHTNDQTHWVVTEYRKELTVLGYAIITIDKGEYQECTYCADADEIVKMNRIDRHKNY